MDRNKMKWVNNDRRHSEEHWSNHRQMTSVAFLLNNISAKCSFYSVFLRVRAEDLDNLGLVLLWSPSPPITLAIGESFQHLDNLCFCFGGRLMVVEKICRVLYFQIRFTVSGRACLGLSAIFHGSPRFFMPPHYKVLSAARKGLIYRPSSRVR